MNDLALKRLTAAGWTPDRKVDYSEIEQLYRDQNLTMPDVLHVFFSSFAYIETYEITDDRNHWHSIDPGSASTEYYGRSFDEYKKKELQPLFEKNGIFGEIYPVGAAHDDYMDIYYHENGKFYLYMNGGGPLIEIGSNVDEMLNYLLGDDDSTRKDIVYEDRFQRMQ